MKKIPENRDEEAQQNSQSLTSSRFRIMWEDGDYYVSIPNYNGGEVVPAEIADELLAALKRAEESMAAHNKERREDSEEAHCAWDFGEDFGGTLDCVRASIAKAEGRT